MNAARPSVRQPLALLHLVSASVLAVGLAGCGAAPPSAAAEPAYDRSLSNLRALSQDLACLASAADYHYLVEHAVDQAKPTAQEEESRRDLLTARVWAGVFVANLAYVTDTVAPPPPTPEAIATSLKAQTMVQRIAALRYLFEGVRGELERQQAASPKDGPLLSWDFASVLGEIDAALRHLESLYVAA